MSGVPTDLVRIARVLKSYGTDGEILVGFREIEPEDMNLQEPVFIFFDGLPVPFFIETISSKGVLKALVHLTGVNNLADAQEISGCDVFASRSSINEYSDEDDGLTVDMLVGWTILSEDGNEVGIVSGYEPIPGNPCLYIDSSSASGLSAGTGDSAMEKSTVMVPLHDDLIVEVDEENKKISLRIPEGLI